MPRKKVRTVTEVAEDIRKSFIHWKELYINGCSDPSWEDGINLNLVRNHCIYYKNEIETLCGHNFFAYPDEYFWPIPPEVPSTYMAKRRTLNCRGVTLEASEREFEITW